MIKRLVATDTPAFYQQLAREIAFDAEADTEVKSVVAEVITAIASDGDQALVDFTRRFDRYNLVSASELEVTRSEFEAASSAVDDDIKRSLVAAAERIREFHQHQVANSYEYKDAHGNRLGQRVSAIKRVGMYVPGGQAAYPSSVLMNAIPAVVAGVDDLIMVTPAIAGSVNPLVLVAAQLAGVNRVFKMGGAQAIAALALGTEVIPKVDKIVGPGNAYVAEAKRALFGRVGLDMVAGPSEILVYTDGHTPPEWIALDLFSQAEHDASAQAILVAPNETVLDRVEEAVTRLLPKQPRKEIIERSLIDRGLFVVAGDEQLAAKVINHIAPEHLELSIEQAAEFALNIDHAGAIFMGRYTAEALGDYCAGPNHVLPTSQTARFSSPLGVYDFQVRTSIIDCTPEGAQQLANIAVPLAEAEGLFAHAASAIARDKVIDD